VPADPVGPAGAVPAFAPHPATNRAAVAALVLVLTSITLYFLANQTLSNHFLEWKEYERVISEATSANGSTVSAMLKYIESQGGSYPGWMVAFSVLSLGSMAAWLGSLVFGAIGLFRPFRRGMAIVALVIAGLLSVMFCLSALGGVTG
jgi:hypothetical protein